MNKNNLSGEVKATLALSEINKRERLLKIVRGKPQWKFHLSVAILIVFFIIYNIWEEHSNILVYLLPLLSIIILVYTDFFRRMNALIELIGEDNLRKSNIDDKEKTT